MKFLTIISRIHIILSALILLFTNYSYSQESEEYEFVPDSLAEEQFYQIRHSGNYLAPQHADNKNAIPNYQSSSNLSDVKFLGPHNIGARARVVLVDKNNSNLIFAGGTTGGLWRSADGGNSWQPVNDQETNLNVTCIAQNPLNPDIIYYGTGEFIGNHTGVAGGGVFKSVDHGNTFVSLSATTGANFEYCTSMRHSLTDSNTLFVACDQKGMFRSQNGGTSFTKVYPGPDRITDIACFADGHILIGINKNGIFTSPTGNTGSFTQFTSGLPVNGYSRIALAYCDSFPQTVYAVYGDTLKGFTSGLVGVFKTTNGGTTWNAVTNPNNNYKYYFPALVLCIAVKPDDPNFVICGGVELAYTTNGGTTWGVAKDFHIDQHIVQFDPNNPAVLYCGNDGGIIRYNTGTINSAYEDLNNGFAITQYFAGCYFPTGENCIIGAQDNNVQFCFNGDSIFKKLNSYFINGCFSTVNQQNPDVSYITDNYGVIYKSTNTLSPTPVYNVVLNDLDANGDGVVDDVAWLVNPFEINLLDGEQLYFVTTKRGWRTSDAAQTWTPITNDVSSIGAPYAIGVSNSTNPIVYFGGEDGLFLRVDNANTAIAGNEVNLHSSIPFTVDSDFISCIKVHPANSGIVYVGFSNQNNQPRIWKVTDANTANPIWININGNLPADIIVNWIECDPFNPDSFLMAATDFGLYYSSDAGANWVKETSIPNVSILNMRLRYSDRKLFVFTHGRGAYTATLPVSILGNNEMETNIKSMKINPNPGNGVFNIQANVKGNYSIVITDESNKRVFRKKYKSDSGTININIDISTHPNGIYMVTIITLDGTLTEKAIKQ